jgi:hypothetical protein
LTVRRRILEISLKFEVNKKGDKKMKKIFIFGFIGFVCLFITGVMRFDIDMLQNVTVCSSCIWPTDGGTIMKYNKHGELFYFAPGIGMDIDVPAGRNVYAVEAGVVVEVVPSESIVIRHNDGTLSFYGNLNTVFLKIGQYVNRGERIALTGIGKKGAYLHLEIVNEQQRYIKKTKDYFPAYY